MRARYFWMLCFGLTLSCDQPAPQKRTAATPKDVTMLKKTPSIDEETCRRGQMVQLAVATPEDVVMLKKISQIWGESYRCGEMVQIVNYLRHLGKDKSLITLREYAKREFYEGTGSEMKVRIICRLLFVNPKGWAPPLLLASVPISIRDAAKNFPLFPIALSDNVPFLLIQGYNFDGGTSESARTDLKLCEDFSLITKDYPLTGYKKAAKALTQKKSFRKLYDKKNVPQMVEMILHQADEPKKDAK